MHIGEVDRRFGARAAKWVWSARPRQVFEPDGSERADLVPTPNIPADYLDTDETPWWTCHPDTKRHDLAVIYRSAGLNDPDRFPVTGPKDLRYVCLALTDAFPLTNDPLAGEFSGYHGCRYVVVAAFEPPITIATMRDDAVLSEWGALKAGFVRAAMSMPETVWSRLVEMTASPPAVPEAAEPGRSIDETLGRPLSEELGPVAVRPRPSRARRGRLEHELELWLHANPKALASVRVDVKTIRRQVLCTPGHDGTIDLLATEIGRPGRYVVVELKAEEVRRDAIAQAVGYVGWLRAQRRVKEASALIIGLGCHRQVPWVLETLPEDLVRVEHWDDLPLPKALQRKLGVVS